MSVNVLKKLIGFSLPTFIGAAISFISVPIATRLFSTADYGIINLFLTYGSVLATACYLGFDQAYVRFYSDQVGQAKQASLLTTCLLVSLIAGSLLAVPLLFVADLFLPDKSSQESFQFMVLLVVYLIAVVVVRYTMLNARLEVNVVSYSMQNIAMVVASKISFLLAAVYTGSYFLAILLISATSIVLAVSFFVTRRRKFVTDRLMEKAEFRKISAFALPIMPSSFLSVFNSSVVLILVNYFFGESLTGVYSGAITISGILLLFQVGFTTYWHPYIYQNHKNFQSKIVFVLKVIVSVMCIVGICVIMFADTIFLLLGEEFRHGAMFLSLLIVVPISYTISEVSGIGINIAKRSMLTLLSQFITLLSNLLICIALVPVVGEFAPALSVAIAAVIRLVMLTFFGSRYYRVYNRLLDIYAGVLLFLAGVAISSIFANDPVIRSACLTAVLIVLIVSYRKTLQEVCSYIVSSLSSGKKGKM